MRHFKNMIARRRPTYETSEAIPVAAAEAATSTEQTDLYLEQARQARSFVPEPERRTCIETHGTGTVAAEPPAAPQDKAAQQVSDASQTDQGAPVDGPAHSPAHPTVPPEGGDPGTRLTSAPKIWDLPQVAASVSPDMAAPLREAPPQTPAPQRRIASTPVGGRVKTRLLGFHAGAVEADPMDEEPVHPAETSEFFPIGWLVVVDGPGRGASFTLTAGLSTLGRDITQTIVLDFGDGAISRERHASVAYDEDENKTYVGHGGKSNIVRHNDKPLLTTEELQDGDTIKLGKTTLRFVAFCTPDFAWADDAAGEGVQDG